MADAVGLNADLELDIARALSQVDQLETALNAATSAVPVDLDFLSSVTSFSDAMAAAVADISTTPVDVPVEADTSVAEQMILDLGNAPPVDVPVDADTTAATATIDALETTVPPIDIPVEADTADASAQIADLGAESVSASEGVSGLEGSVTGLGAAAGIAEGSARELVAAVGEIGGESGKAAAGGVLALTAATSVFFEAGLDAVSAGQRFDLVLGDMGNKIKEINVNGLNVSMEDLGISFGSTGAEMENVNSKLFQNAINAGVSKDKAVEFTQQIETLSARAISLNPQLGTLGDVASTLGDKIARGGKFASNYGIQLTAAEIATRALTDTGKTEASQLTIVEKSIAGAELASEKYGDTLAGTVAEGQKNAAVQAESLKASFKEAIEQIGVPLVAPILDLLREAEPDAVLIAQTLGTLAGDVLPLVSEALAVLGPPLQLVAYIIDAIPGPLVAGAVAAYAMAAALGALDAALIGLAIPIAPIALALGAVVAGIGIFNSVFGDTPPYVDDVTKAIDTAAKSLDDYETSVHDVIASEVEAATKSDDFRNALNRANVTTDDLTRAVSSGQDAFIAMAQRIQDANGGLDLMDPKSRALAEDLNHLYNATQEEAQATLNSAVAHGDLTKEQVAQAVAQSEVTTGHANLAVALDTLQPKLKAAKDAEAEQAQAEKDAADKAKALQDALGNLGTVAPDVATALNALQVTTGPTGETMLSLATSIDKANLSSTQMEAIAGSLGVSVDDLKAFAKDASAQIDSFVADALKGIPTVGAAIDAVLNPPEKPDKPIIIDPAKLQAEIDDDLAKIEAFNTNMAFLQLNGLNNLAKVATEKGPEFTAALVKSIQDSPDGDVGKALNDKFAELNTAVANEGPAMRVAGQGIITATGDIAATASADFHGKLNVVQPTQEQVDRARLVAELANVPFAQALASVAGDGAVAYEQAIGAIAPATSTAMGGAAANIVDGQAAVSGAASDAGAGAAGGFASGMGPLPANADAIIGDTGGAISRAAFTLRAIADTEGFFVGYAFTKGLADGVGDSGAVADVATQARNAVQAGINAARSQAGVRSPSRVMAELGEQMAAGLALGLADTSAVEASARGLAAAAVPLASVSASVGSVGSPSMTPVGVGGGPLIGSLTVNVDGTGKSKSDLRRDGFTVAGAIVDRLTPAAGQRLSTAVKVL